MTRILCFILITVLAFGCKPEVSPIQYGQDACHWCQMQIADPKFGAEAVTSKGRTYKFDAAECMLYYLAESDNEHAFLVVSDFANPEHFVDADKAVYLVSKNMPSPMGGYLNAFSSHEKAKDLAAQNGGDIFTWSQMLDKYSE